MPNFPSFINTTSSSDRFDYDGLPPELAAESQAVNRRQQMANYLIQQGLQPAQGQMAGRFYVPPSPLQGLAGLAQVAAGMYGNYKADEKRQVVADKSKSMLADAMQKYKEASDPVNREGPRPTAQVMPPPQNLGPHAGLTPQPQAQPQSVELPGPGAPVLMPRSPDEKRQAIVDHLLLNQHPQAQAVGKILAQQADQAEQRGLDRDVRREGITSNAELRKGQIEAGLLNTQALIDAKQSRGERTDALQKQLANQQAELKKMEIDTKRETLKQGKTPPGYRQTQGGDLEAIPGGPADVKKEAVYNQDTAMLQNASSGMDRLAESANQILNHPGLAGITGLRGAIPDVPGTQAADARALLNKLKSQVGFSVLQEMRNNSKTGGALGAVSDAEGKRLENNLASVDSAQSIDQMRRELKGILDYATGAKDRLREAYNLKHKAGTTAPYAAPSAAPGKARKYNPATGKIE